MSIALSVLYFLSLLTIPHLLFRKKHPSATLAWLWGILLFPFLGALLYLAIGTDRLKRKRLHRRASFTSSRPHRKNTDWANPSLSPGDAALVSQIARLNQIPVTQVDDTRLLPDADKFYDALLIRIAEARHHIHIQFYIWRKDATGDIFIKALVAAAQRGVKVRVLLDEVGCFFVPASYFKPIVDSGGEFSWFLTISPRRQRYLLNLRNHRKLQVIDGAIAFVGGMNIGREYQGLDPSVGGWRDMQIELTGPAACVLQESFADDWYFATKRHIEDECYYPKSFQAGPFTTLVVAGGPDSIHSPVQKSLLAMLNHTQKRIWLTSGYFVPNSVTLTAMQLCAARGVDVRLLISGKSDHPILLHIGRSYYEELLESGVRLFEYNAAIHHCKAGVIDDDWLLVGSANLDNRSMHLNFELNVLIHMPERTAELAAILKKDYDSAVEIKLDKFRNRPLRQKWIEAIVRPFGPVL
ncbi:cardiolipin synthase [Rariglobus hedericola]|uniref:Cardiolipin synthase n=1 Tax=Rariglobus hedericola TaxID=2597822 RepID=A0A556QLB2_9BACT|nr:cardiolipin synthase [Rariglobus hedericola]TSJ77424.1 cardiolipin synthase [Rariglobus hedericola]